jgi:ComF family protein
MRFLLDLLLPPVCPGCGREDAVLCAACRAPLWRRMHEPAGVPIGMPAALPAGLLQLEWCAMYSGPVRAAVHAFKYRGERRLSRPLGEALAERWTRAGRGGTLLTWVPVHPSRRRERGFDQAEELAMVAGGILGLQRARCLERRQRTRAQHGLGQQARAGNTAGAFEVAPAAAAMVAGSWVILVDDIVTTGATLAGCADALLAAGAAAVSAIAVARDR